MSRAHKVGAGQSRGHRFALATKLFQAGVVVPFVGALALTGCAENVEPLEPTNISVRGVELPAELAEVRTQVLELCNTGEGSGDVRKAWTDLGFEETTGTTWIDAFTFSADFGYNENPNAVIFNGEASYPTIHEVAQNCLEAAKLISTGLVSSSREDASLALEEMRSLPYDPTTDILSQIATNIEVSQDKGII